MKPDSSPLWAERILEIAAVAALYYAAARVGLLLSFEKTNASPVWPPSGIAFAAMLLRGYRVWPGILLGAFLANVAVFLQDPAVSPWAAGVSLLIGIGNTLEAVIGSFLLRRFSGRPGPGILDRTRDVFKLVAVALVMCLISSSLGPAALCAAGMAPWSLHAKIWFTWWSGDLMGVLVITPMILVWSRPLPAWDPRRSAEAAASFALIAAVSWFSYGDWPLPREAHYPLVFLTVPLLLWPAFRSGRRGVATALFIVSGITVWRTIHGDGPFIQRTAHESLMLLLGFIGVVTTMVLVISAALAERREAEEGLRRIQEGLEARIQGQTADLKNNAHSLLAEIAKGKQAEEELRAKSEELARSNQELNQFASVASHDLQEPLRKILAFGDLLCKRLGGTLDPESQDYLQRMQRSAERMGRLIEDLLALARVTTKAKPHEKVELAAVTQEVLSDLEPMISGSGVRIEVGPLPQVHADPLQMRQLLQNLIANAIKFRRKDESPRIQVRGKNLRNGFCEIAVQDNGIGFDEKFLGRIFRPFQRLHSRADYEGSGIGLAICDRIVLRHGGTIFAKSSPGKGSLFIVVLPTPYGDPP
ncbi:MAG: MASE1 domain-containing protein [Elusimicrobiota bacterium]